MKAPRHFKQSNRQLRQRPIVPGSVLHRMMEMIANEIAQTMMDSQTADDSLERTRRGDKNQCLRQNLENDVASPSP